MALCLREGTNKSAYLPRFSCVPVVLLAWMVGLGQSRADPLGAVVSEEGIVYVRESATGTGESWLGATSDLQGAVDAAALWAAEAECPAQVWVAEGAYKPQSWPRGGTGPRDMHFSLRNQVSIYGGFPADAADGRDDCDELSDRNPWANQAVFSGDIGIPGDMSDNCYHVFYHPDGVHLDQSAVLDGVTIMGGNADGPETTQGDGGGMANRQDNLPTLVGCLFTGNSASRGGGMFGPSTASKCMFLQNSARLGGAIYRVGSDSRIQDCFFLENRAVNGGGIWSAFVDFDSPPPLVANCVFSRNCAEECGGGFYDDDHAVLVNCTFAGNAAGEYGAGVYGKYHDGGGTIITHQSPITVYGTRDMGNGSPWIWNRHPTIANCILWGSDNELGGDAVGATVNCLVGEDRLWAHPEPYEHPDSLFVDFAHPLGVDGVPGTADDGLILCRGTQAVDAGGEQWVPSQLMQDVRGMPRRQGDAIDLGAYECSSAPSTGSAVLFRVWGDGLLAAEGGAPGRWIELTGSPSDSFPAVTAVSNEPATDSFVSWVDDHGEVRLPRRLVLDRIGESRIWTAVFTPAIPNANATVYVRPGGTGNGTSWDAAFGEPQKAMDCAALWLAYMGRPAVQVWVAEGVYTPASWPNGGTDAREKHFALRNGVTVYGGFPGDAADGRDDCDDLEDREPQSHQTVFSGDIGITGDPADNCYHVFYHPAGAALDGSAVLDGCVIEAGNADGEEAPSAAGGGMLNVSSFPTLRGCVLRYCVAAEAGGGMYSTDARPALVACTFAGNRAGNGGGLYLESPFSVVLPDCRFLGNRAAADGGAVYAVAPLTIDRGFFESNSAGRSGGGMCGMGSSVMTGCVFRGNSAGTAGGGIRNGSRLPLIANCVFDGNLAAEGGGAFNDAAAVPVFAGCVFVGNASDSGGGMFSEGSGSAANCTFSGNAARNTGGAIGHVGELYWLVTNCIFDAGPESVSDGTMAGYTFNLVSGGDLSAWPLSNRTGDPVFADALNPAGADGRFGTPDDGLRLLPGSPALDAGNSSPSLPRMTTDLVGEPRVQGVAIDLGAYERTPPPDGTLEVAFKVSGNGRLRCEAHEARWFSVTVPPGEPSPTVTALSGSLEDTPFLHWLDAAGNMRIEEDLVLHSVTSEQTWTAVFGSSLPPGPVVVRVRKGGLGDGSSWHDAAGDVQDAITRASLMRAEGEPQAQVWVAAGTYVPSSWPNGGTHVREKHFALRNGVAVYGGFPADAADGRDDCDELSDRDPAANPTILSGDLGTVGDASDNCYHVFFHPAEAALDQSAAFDGFTVTGGNADGNDNVHSLGGGMFNQICSPTLEHCVFSENSASARGGALFNQGGSPQISECRFSGNTTALHGAAVQNIAGSQASFRECILVGNAGPSGCGAMRNESGSSPTVIDCVFLGNQGRGMYNLSDCVPTVTRSFFVGNSREGMLNIEASPVVDNCVFGGNGGPGMSSSWWHSAPVVTNCTFAGNSVDPRFPGRRCGIYSGVQTRPVVANCVFWGNGTDVLGGDSASFTNNTIGRALFSDGSRISTGPDPLLADCADPAGPDGQFGTADDGLRLLPGSPAIDAGDQTALPQGVTTDAGGVARVQGAEVDRGAYEHRPLATDQVFVSCRVSGTGLLRSGGEDARRFEFAVSKAAQPPAVLAVENEPASGHFLLWVSAGGAVHTEKLLSLGGVVESQVWTAVFAPVLPDSRGVVYVRSGGSGDGSSWNHATGDLQAAIESAALWSRYTVGAAEVWLAAGTYRPAGWPNGWYEERNRHFSLRNGVAVLGGFPADATDGRSDCDETADRNPAANPTILSGDNGTVGDTSDNCFHVLFHPEETFLDQSAGIDGVTITGGNADVLYRHDSGGGIHNAGSRPTITRCTIAGNSARAGGGLYVSDAAFFRLEGCTFADNTASYGGAINTSASGLEVVNCLFARNTASGGGGAMSVSAGPSTLLSRCVFTGNEVPQGSGGAVYAYTDVTVRSCVFEGNVAWNGGALEVEDLTMVNCTLVDNGNDRTNGVVSVASSYTEERVCAVSNCIFQGASKPFDLHLLERSRIQFNLLPPGTSMALFPDSNVEADPMFADSANPAGPDGLFGTVDDGLRLLPASPAADRGDGGALSVGMDLDVRGLPRVAGSAVDLGAYEQPAAPPGSVSVAVRTLGGAMLRCGAREAQLLEFQVPSGGTIPLVLALPDAESGEDFFFWESADGTLNHENPLDLQHVTRDQTWTLVLGPARPDANGVVYVKPDGSGDGSCWDRAAGDLQAAIEAGAQWWTYTHRPAYVWIAAGTYKPASWPNGGTDAQEMHFSLRSGVTVCGGFPADATDGRSDCDEAANRNPKASPTILSGDIGVAGDMSDNCHHVFYHPREAALDSTAMLQGCTITGGHCANTYTSGGAMCNVDSSPTLEDCTFLRNNARLGGALAMFSGSRPVISGCTFVLNSADSGGALYSKDSAPALVYCTFVGNRADSRGGAIATEDDDGIAIVNCTFAGNQSQSGGGAIDNRENSTWTVTNCILWGNGRETSGGRVSNISHCFVDKADMSYWPESNRNDAPLFVRMPSDGGDGWGDDPNTPEIDESANDDYGNLRLRAGSPAIDAGTDAGLPSGQTDADGRNVPLGGAVDVGAYEFGPPFAVEFRAASPAALLGGGGTGASVSTQIVPAGSDCEPMGVRVPEGYQFQGWQEAGGGIYQGNPLIVRDVSDNQSWLAQVAPRRFPPVDLDLWPEHMIVAVRSAAGGGPLIEGDMIGVYVNGQLRGVATARTSTEGVMARVKVGTTSPDETMTFRLWCDGDAEPLYYGRQSATGAAIGGEGGLQVEFALAPTLTVHPGWNALGIDIEPDAVTADELLGDTRAAAWIWDPGRQQYARAAEVHAGMGIWVHWAGEQTFTTRYWGHDPEAPAAVALLSGRWYFRAGIAVARETPEAYTTGYAWRWNAGMNALQRVFSSADVPPGEAVWLVLPPSP